MRSPVIAGVLLVLLSATAPATPNFYLTEDSGGALDDCSQHLAPFIMFNLYLFVESAEVDLVSGAEFRIGNLPGLDEGVVVTCTWHTLIVDGDPGYGIALTFIPPVPGPLVALGGVSFFALLPTGVGADHCLELLPSLYSNQLAIWDGDYNVLPGTGYVFVFNSTADPYQDCAQCPGVVASETSDWSRVKSLY